MNREDKETRVEYKDKMKLRAHFDMKRIGQNLDLSEAVVDLGHRYFCFYRDSKSKVTDMPKREAQCLILALREKKSEGVSIQKVHAKGFAFFVCITSRLHFECPQCKMDFPSRLDLLTHQCSADRSRKQTKERKAVPLIKKKVELKDELAQLKSIIERRH